MFRILALVSLALAICCILTLSPFFGWLSGQGFSWTMSLILPQVFILLFSLSAAFFIWKAVPLKPLFNWGISIVVLGGLIGWHAFLHPPYIEDYVRESEIIEEGFFERDGLEKYLASNYGEFRGLVAIASPGCKYCQQAARRLEKMQERGTNSDLLVVMYSDAEEDIDYFVEMSGAEDLDYILTPDPDATLEACEGRFPTFLYFKEGRFTHRWHNSDFGYPAMDWIEEGI